MEIRFLKLIKTIVEEGNLANSSEKLFLSPSALSHQLKDLEIQLGFKVFYRTRNNWDLTEEGKVLYETACTVMGSIDIGLKAIQRIRSGAAGRIKISTECYSFYQGLPLFIQQMSILYPEIEVELALEATHQPRSKVINHEIDIAVVTSISEDQNLTNLEIFEDEVFALVHEESIFGDKDYISPYEFSDIHLIIHSFPLKTVSIYEQFLSQYNILPTKISAIPLTEVALEMVQANLGVICMPMWALRSFKLSEKLKFKKIGRQGFKRKHYLVIRKSDLEKKYISTFLLNFKEYFQNFH